jgi:hypothetical protein
MGMAQAKVFNSDADSAASLHPDGVDDPAGCGSRRPPGEPVRCRSARILCV